jgi:hypothetical protein
VGTFRFEDEEVMKRRNIVRSLAVAVASAVTSTLLAVAPGAAMAAPARSNDAARARQIAQQVADAVDPQAVLSRLSAADLDLYRKGVTPVKVVEAESLSQTASASFSGCWQRDNFYSAHNVLGYELYRFGQITRVCASGGSVSSVSVPSVSFNIYWPGWRLDNRWTSTNNVGWEGRGQAQFLFIFREAGVDLRYEYPCAQLRLNADGVNVSGSQSCDIWH